ncbi:MAG: hypothetical protein ABI671_14115 [Burkholderiales bacterium]
MTVLKSREDLKQKRVDFLEEQLRKLKGIVERYQEERRSSPPDIEAEDNGHEVDLFLEETRAYIGDAIAGQEYQGL